MANTVKIRNVSGEPRHVAELNYRIVDVDEVFEVPANRAEGYTCQTAIWAADDAKDGGK